MLLSLYISGLLLPMDAPAFAAGLALAHTCGKRGDAPAILEEARSSRDRDPCDVPGGEGPLPAETADLAGRLCTAAALLPVE